jgi:hypothetical protein
MKWDRWSLQIIFGFLDKFLYDFLREIRGEIGGILG